MRAKRSGSNWLAKVRRMLREQVAIGATGQAVQRQPITEVWQYGYSGFHDPWTDQVLAAALARHEAP